MNVKTIIDSLLTIPEKERFTAIQMLRDALFQISPQKSAPVDNIQWIPLDKVQANDYNPNSVAMTEMKLLHLSISSDGYTQPVVTIYDKELDKYVIVDGFHRHLTMKLYPDIYERFNGLLPCVVIDKPINDRMASTVRHNRARGKHSVSGMADMVFTMLENGWSDADICNELGMEVDEILRLKHITGFSKLFENVEYRKAWESIAMLRIRKAYHENQTLENGQKEQEAQQGSAQHH